MVIIPNDGPEAGAAVGGGSRAAIVTHPITGLTPSPNAFDTVQQMQEQMAAMKTQIEALTTKQPATSASRSGASRRRRKATAQATQATHATQYTQRPSAKDRLGQQTIVTDATGRVIQQREQTPSPRRRSDNARTERTTRTGGYSTSNSQSTTGQSLSQTARHNDIQPRKNRDKAPVQYDADGREIIPNRSSGHDDQRGGHHRERYDKAPSRSVHNKSPRRIRGDGHLDKPGYDIDGTGDFIVVRDPRTGESKRYRAETPPTDSGKRKDRPQDLGTNDERHRLNAKKAFSTGKAYEAPRSTEKSADSRLRKIQDSPYIQKIQETQPPRNFTIPKFTKYDAKTDAVKPVVHLSLT